MFVFVCVFHLSLQLCRNPSLPLGEEGGQKLIPCVHQSLTELQPLCMFVKTLSGVINHETKVIYSVSCPQVQHVPFRMNYINLNS